MDRGKTYHFFTRNSKKIGVAVSVTTVGNFLEGAMYTMKQVHYEPITMNNSENKIKRLFIGFSKIFTITFIIIT